MLYFVIMPPGSTWVVQFLRLCAVLVTLTVWWELVRCFVDCLKVQICLMFFIMIILGLWVWGQKITEVKYPSHYSTAKIQIIIMIYDCWYWPFCQGEVVFFGLLYCNTDSPTSPYLGKITPCNTNLKHGEVPLTLMVVHLIKPYVNLLEGIIVYFHLHMYSIN